MASSWNPSTGEDEGTAIVQDAVTGLESTWSSQKITTEINSATPADIIITSVTSTGGTTSAIVTNNSIVPGTTIEADSEIGTAVTPFRNVHSNKHYAPRFLNGASYLPGSFYAYNIEGNPSCSLDGGTGVYGGTISGGIVLTNTLGSSSGSAFTTTSDMGIQAGLVTQASFRFGADFANGFYQTTGTSISYTNGTEEKVRFADGINIRNSAFNKMGIYFGADNPTLTGIFQGTANTFGFSQNGVTRLTIGNNSDVEISNSPLKLFAGNIGAPGLNLGDATTGFYRPALNQIAATISSTQRLLINSSGITVTGTATLPTVTASGIITTAVGSALAPSLVIGGDTGFHRINTTTLGISTGGAARLYIDSSGMTTYQGASKPGGGSWADSSDSRLKENINNVPVEDCLNRISMLQVKTYQYTEEAAAALQRNPLKVYTGMIAQEYYAAYPHVTQNTSKLTINGVEDDYLMLDTTVASFELFGAIKALKIRVEAQALTISDLQSQMVTILSRLDALENP